MTSTYFKVLCHSLFLDKLKENNIKLKSQHLSPRHNLNKEPLK